MNRLIRGIVARTNKRANIAVLIISNVVLIVAAILLSAAYSHRVEEKQIETEVESFCSTLESMKQIASSHLQMESRHVQDWASYIEKQNMTMDQALDYIREENAQSDRVAHILDMDTYDAYSTQIIKGSNQVKCYRYLKYLDTEAGRKFNESVRKSFAEKDGKTYLLGRYRVSESQVTVISVGTRVTLREKSGVLKDYLLLRVIPVDSMKSIWVFPMEYQSAGVGMITADGDYIIQPAGMSSSDFIEYIRSYNYAEDYNGVEELVEELATQSHGVLRYKNSKRQDCYWYFSKYEDNANVCILGYIPVDSLDRPEQSWVVVAVTCAVFLLLAAIDGTYMLHINRKLRKTYVLAEQASAAKTRFLSAMSHDIRTPMNAVIGMTNIARQHLEEPDYVKDCLEKVKLSSRHLMTLINDILDVSRYESGRIRLSPVEFNLEESIRELEHMIVPDVEKKHLDFKIFLEEIECPRVIGDEMRLKQIWINLMSNAVKYTPEGGKVEIWLREGNFDREKLNTDLIFIILDTGVGMSPEFQQVMYDAFARVTDSRIDKNSGSGLGLAIVKQSVDLMQGTIQCESIPDVGTMFTVRVTLQVPEQQEKPATVTKKQKVTITEEERTAFRGMKVLVAEDNDLNWKIIDIILRQYGVACDRVETGKACVERLLETPEYTYDMVFMDMQMPVMGGKEATALIRSSRREDLQKLLIFAMTADAYAEDIQECLDAGMDGHIAKPIDVEKVCEALYRARNKRDKEGIVS